jgi:hypothetical protein
MRERHVPRLCPSCAAPMARQELTCWRCEAACEDRSARRSARLVVRGGHAARRGGGGQSSTRAVIGEARAVAQARFARHRLAGERGSWAARGSGRVAARVAAVR